MYWSMILLINTFTVAMAAANHDDYSLWFVAMALALLSIKSAISGWK